MIKRIMAVLAAVLVLFSLAACHRRKPLEISDEEALAVLRDLVPRSYELNVIFFGEGLPAVGAEGEYTDTTYLPVTDDCGYASIRQIKAAAEKVYSLSYLQGVYVPVFEGLVATSEDGLLDNNLSARYKEFYGRLYVDVAHDRVDIRGRLTVTACAVKKKTPDYVSVLTECLDENGEKVTTTFLLTLENDVWLLDGPTY